MGGPDRLEERDGGVGEAAAARGRDEERDPRPHGVPGPDGLDAGRFGAPADRAGEDGPQPHPLRQGQPELGLGVRDDDGVAALEEAARDDPVVLLGDHLAEHVDDAGARRDRLGVRVGGRHRVVDDDVRREPGESAPPAGHRVVRRRRRT